MAASIQEQKRQQAGNLAEGEDYLAIQAEALQLSTELPTEHVVEKQAKLAPKFEALFAKIEKQLEFQREVEQYGQISGRDQATRSPSQAKFARRRP